METFTGSVERITYYNDENGYSVIKVKPEKRMSRERTSREGLVTVVGAMPELGEGETAEFTGEWVEDPRYGQQMRVQTVHPVAPNSLKGITRYLSSGIVKGIGPRTAERIVDHFGLKTLDVLNRDPQRLHEIPGLKTNLADKLAEAWRENYAVRQTMIFLQGYGVSARMGNKIYAVFGAATINTVKEDPYQLADEVFGIGFIKADQIARNMGLEDDSPQRVRAGVKYALSRLSQDGHTYAPFDLLVDTTRELLQVENVSLITNLLKDEVERGELVMEWIKREDQELQAVYLPMFHRSEVGATERLRIIANTPSVITELATETNWLKFLARIAEDNNVELSDQQQSAVQAALSSKVSVLTGGPGTGKTTTLQMVIRSLEDLDFTYALASPTGRAAKRLSEATMRPASTIHRLFGFSPHEGFSIDEDAPLQVDMLIIDEASMIDLILFYNVLRGIPPETHLMLVGDVDQLPSVGAGNVLNDVINSDVAYVTRLETIFRQSAQSHIIINAHRVNEGQVPHMDNQSADFFFFREEDPAIAAKLVVDIVYNRIPQKFPDTDPITDVQVIAPMYRGPAGVDSLNQRLQAQLNPEALLQAEVKINGSIFRRGDKIMQTRNDYDKDVFNGDIGIVYGINQHDNTLDVLIDNNHVYFDYATQETDNLIHAYCISIHRSQGSEYPIVVIPLLTQHYMMLQRNLLYTAITRARKAVIMVGNKQAVRMAVQNNKVAERFSGLLPRLRGF